MNLKVIPVIQLFLAGIAIYLIHHFFPQIRISFSFQNLISYVLSGAAFLILVFSLQLFWRAGTTADPAHPEKASKLVTGGIYKVTRNPMYLAMLLILLGFTVKIGNPFGLIPVMAFVWSMTQFQIKPEETALTEMFGDSYLEYQKQVRRWI